ncbi:MAG: L-threonylcarbamoyladenylate synthase [Thermoplasmatota archaeon]
MTTLLDPAAIRAHVQAGGLLAFPTETVWSLSCRPDDPAAVDRLRAAKGRPDAVPLALGVADWSHAQAFVALNPLAQALAHAFLPGPVSLVCPRLDHRLAHLAPGFGSLSLRVPDHPVAQAVLQATGPLVMTSANRHGEPDPPDRAGVERGLVGTPDLLVIGDETVAGTASTVVDCTGDAPRILRQGNVTADAIGAVLKR